MARITRTREPGGRSPASEGNLPLETIANNEKQKNTLEIPTVSKEQEGRSRFQFLEQRHGLATGASEPSSESCTLERKSEQPGWGPRP